MSCSSINQSNLSKTLWTSLLCDAACVQCHWQYDDKIVQQAKRKHKTLIFLDPKSTINPFYAIPNGFNSFYGDQLLALINVCGEKNNNQSIEIAYGKALQAMFDCQHSTIYGEYDEEKTSSISRDDYPIQGGWRSHSLRFFLAKSKQTTKITGCAPSDDQMDGVAKVVALVVDALVQPKQSESAFFENVINVISITQIGSLAICCALIAAFILLQLHKHAPLSTLAQRKTFFDSKILSALLNNKETPCIKMIQAFDQLDVIRKYIENALNSEHTLTAHKAFVAEQGKGCGPFAISNVIHAFLTFPQLDDAIEATIEAGGDCCSRAIFIGAVFGMSGAPSTRLIEKWSNKVPKNRLEILEKAISTLVGDDKMN